MKTRLRLTYLAIVMTTLSFAQTLEKIDTNEPISINYVEEQGKLLAKSEVYKTNAEIQFRDKATGNTISIGLTMDQFRVLSDLLTSYDNRDRDFYSMDIKSSKLFIRFIEKYGYVQPHIYLVSEGSTLRFPELNKLQFIRLFRGA